MAQDHFVKHGASEGQVDWNFNVIFDGCPEVVEMAQQYAPLVTHPGLYSPIPAKWLHATILRVGPEDDFTKEEMLAVAECLHGKLAKLELPEFRFDSWWLWGGNVVLHISPADEFTKIYDAVISALEQIVGPERTLKSPYGGRFIAHTALAYTRSHHKEHEINQQLASKLIHPASFKVSYLPLIRQWPTGGHYEWEIIRKIPIGGDRP